MSGSFQNGGSPTSGTTTSVPGLAPGTEYDFQVTASNNYGSATSPIVTATTPAGSPPSAPIALTISNLGPTSLTLYWGASTGAAPITYTVQYQVSGASSWTVVASGLTGLSDVVNGLTPSTTYVFSVIATNPGGTAQSSPYTVITPAVAIAPSAPQALRTNSVSVNTITLYWQASATGTLPITYQAQYRVAGQPNWINFGTASGQTTAAITNLTANTAYELRVVATNSAGQTPSAQIQAQTTTTGIPPSSPTLTIASVTPNSATLTWTASPSGDAPITYQPEYQAVGQNSWSSSGSPIAGLTATVSNLVPGATYNFRVVALNSFGSSVSPDAVAATVLPATPPGAPGTPTAWIITPTSVSLTWTPSATGSGPIQYTIQYVPHGQANWISAGASSTANANTALGLTPNVDYDFRIQAANNAGVSYSPILTILAPISGGTVSTASFQPNQVLTAEDLDAALNAKLDSTGGAVGPLTQTQTGNGGGQPSTLAISRTTGGLNDAPLISGTYTAVMADGPVIAYGSVAMTLTLTGDASGNGPAGNVWNVLSSLTVQALRSGVAGATGSVHAPIMAQLKKATPSGGVPAGRRMPDTYALYAPVTDTTNLPSSQGGATTGINLPILANGRDDMDVRYGASINYGENLAVASGGQPLEFSRGLFLGASTTTAYSKVILELGGLFSTAAVDLRSANGVSAVIISATPSAAVTTITVDKVLMFASAGSPAKAITASNPKKVTINGNSYSVVSVSITAGASSGTLTFASPVSSTDAAQGNAVIPVNNHTIWLSEGSSGTLPGDIAFNAAGTSVAYFDPAGGGLVLAGGAGTRVSTKGSALRVPVGNTGQRPGSPLFGDLRGNTDTNTYEGWNPATSQWISFGTTASASQVPGPATALVAGTPTSSAVSLSWTAPQTGTQPFSYQVQYRVSGVAAWTNWGAPQSATTSTVTGLTSGTRYDFEIITSNAYGSSVSAIASATVGSVAPAAVTGLATSNATSTTMTLSWTASATGTAPISYQAQVSPTGANTWTNSGSLVSGTSITLTGLTAATTYDFRIVASNVAGSATSSTVTAATTAAATVAPTTPTSVSAGTPTSSSLVVSWSAPATGTAPFSYQVLYRVTGSSSFANFGTAITGTTETVTGLNAQTSYDFEVTAINSAGSATSSAVTAITSAPPAASTGSVTGSQTSGSSSPVIAGPASGTVTTNNVLAVTGITLTDPGAAVASGSCTLTITCTTGTVTTTVAGSQVAGSGSASITYQNTLAACQTAAADLLYAAPATAGSANITVKLLDQSSHTNSLVIPITVAAPATGGGPSGTIPTDATGESAVNAQAVLNGFGVNTKIWTSGYQTAGLPLIENCVNYLGGIKYLRDGSMDPSVSTWWPQVAQACSVTFVGYIGFSNQTDWATLINHMGGVPGQYLAAFEGIDEADTGQAQGFAETLAQAAAFQQSDIFPDAQQYGLPAIQMSFGQGWTTNPTQGNYGTVGNLSAYATYGNAHCVPSQNPRPMILQNIGNAGLATPGKAAAVTEIGWNQQTGSGFGSCSPATGAAYILMTIFDCYNAGAPFYFWNELIDNVSAEGSASRGLFTDTGTARPSAVAVKNLFSLLLDTASNATSFTPGKLNYTLTGMPTAQNNTGGYHTLMQKSDGSFWLAVWNEQPLNSTADGSDIAVSAVNVTLTLGATPVSIAVYDPTNSTTAVQTAGAVTSLTFSLPARVILIKVVHA